MAVVNNTLGSMFNSNNLLGYYKCEDTLDSSGYNHTLTATPAILTISNSGKFSKCFLSAGGHARVEDGLGISGGAITMSAWAAYEVDPNEGSQYNVMCQRDGNSTYTSYRLRYERQSGINYVQAVRSKHSVGDQVISVVKTLIKYKWYHYVFTYDTAYMRLYLDGVCIGGPTSASGNGLSEAIGNRFNVGGKDDSPPGDWSPWFGRIDEVLVFNRVWDPQEVYNYYQQYSSALNSGISF